MNQNNCSSKEQEQQQQSTMFLTMDNKLAIRRRNNMNNNNNIDYIDDNFNDNDNDYDNKQQQQQQQNNMNNTNDKKFQQMIKNFIKFLQQNYNYYNINMNRIIKNLLINIFMSIFISIVQLYTWLTLPIYFLTQKPWIKREKNLFNRVKILNDNNDNLEKQINNDNNNNNNSLSPIYSRNDSNEYNHSIFKLETLTEIIDQLPNVHGGNNLCLGYRKIISEELLLDENGQEKRIDGRKLKQYRLSDYHWFTYNEINKITNNLSQGFLHFNINENNKIMIISETRIEWMLCFQSLLRCGATISTVFSNLGIDGISYAINETNVDTIIVSLECIPILESSIKRLNNKHNIKNIIYFDEPIIEPNITINIENNNNNVDENENNLIKILSLSEIESVGKKILSDNNDSNDKKLYVKPDVNKVLIIMYTSGTTGQPKAAQITQKQFIASLRALFVLVRHIMHTAPHHIYISYLPMAHVLELTLELFFFVGGVRVGFAAPFTLTDSAPGLAKGEKSDIKLLKPTVMTTVPLVLDRIIKEVNDKLRSRTPISQPIFEYLMNYKSYWTRHGYNCNIVKKLLCNKVREQFGGNIQFMICGGAPLNPNTQSTIKSALDVTLIQGYGATETTGAVLCMDFDELEYGRVGAPLGEVYLRLRDWPDGGYSINDKPNPRGEILIGGDCVVKNYFKKQELSDEVFFTDNNGIRWFQTGDIGEIFSNGTVKIIDRCKDLIKLQNGEYISLGKVEAALKYNQFVDNVCVYGGTFSNDIVAIISINRKSLKLLINNNKFNDDKNHLNIDEQCNDLEINQYILNDIQKTSKQLLLTKKETPKRILLVSEIWSPDNGILTAALKLKRRVVEQIYKKQLFDLYNDDKFNINNNNFNYKNNEKNSLKTTTTTTTNKLNYFDQNNNNTTAIETTVVTNGTKI